MIESFGEFDDSYDFAPIINNRSGTAETDIEADEVLDGDDGDQGPSHRVLQEQARVSGSIIHGKRGETAVCPCAVVVGNKATQMCRCFAGLGAR